MSDTTKPPAIFWIITVIGILWHVGTVMNFFQQMSPAGIADMPEQYRAIADSRPVWATAGFAVAGFGGLIGCALMLMRRALALPFLWASLVGVVVQMIPALANADGLYIGSIVMVFAMTLVVIGFLIWYARRSAANGILR